MLLTAECIVLEPRELVAPFEIQAETLSMMDSAVENLKKGMVSEPVDLTDWSHVPRSGICQNSKNVL